MSVFTIFSNQKFTIPTYLKIKKDLTFQILKEKLEKYFHKKIQSIFLNFGIPFQSLDILTYCTIFGIEFNQLFIIFDEEDEILSMNSQIYSLILSFSRLFIENSPISHSFMNSVLSITGFAPYAFSILNQNWTQLATLLYSLLKIYSLQKNPDMSSLQDIQDNTILNFFMALCSLHSPPQKIGTFSFSKSEQITLFKTTNISDKILIIPPITPLQDLNLTFQQLSLTKKPFPTYTLLQSLYFSSSNIIKISDAFGLSIPSSHSIFNPLNNDNQIIAFDNGLIQTVQQMLFIKSNQPNSIFIDYSHILQTFSLCVDLSIYNQDYLTLTKEYISSFCNSIRQYRTTILGGIISYSSIPSVIMIPAPMSPEFSDVCNKFSCSGESHLWDALYTSVIATITGNMQQDSFLCPQSKSRIILVTSGVESGSIHKYAEIEELLLTNNIILDIIITHTHEPNCIKSLRNLSHKTKGLTMLNPDVSIITAEAFINLEIRNSDIKNDDNEFDKEAPNKFFTKCQISNFPKETALLLIKEFKKMSSLNQNHFRTIIDEHEINKWIIMIKGPKKSPYRNKWFKLIAMFSANFPKNPPLFRFLNIPYHVNINNEGRICLNLLDIDYSSSFTVSDLVCAIRYLLKEPNFEDPLDFTKKKEYDENPSAFELKAFEESQKTGQTFF